MNSKAVVLRALLFLAICPLVLVFSGPLGKAGSPLTGMLLVGAVTSLLTFLLTILFVRWDGLALRDVGTAWRAGTALRLLFGFAVGIGLVALQAVFIYAGGHVHWVSAALPHAGRLVALALAAYLLVALREELAFRGYPLRRFESVWGMWLAILFVAAVFALEHKAGGLSWSQSLLGPFAGGLLFGLAALATRGIAVPLGIHAAFNFGQWAMGQKEIAGLWRPVVDAGFAHQAEVLGYSGYLTGILLACAGFWLWSRRRA